MKGPQYMKKLWFWSQRGRFPFLTVKLIRSPVQWKRENTIHHCRLTSRGKISTRDYKIKFKEVCFVERRRSVRSKDQVTDEPVFIGHVTEDEIDGDPDRVKVRETHDCNTSGISIKRSV